MESQLTGQMSEQLNHQASSPLAASSTGRHRGQLESLHDGKQGEMRSSSGTRGKTGETPSSSLRGELSFALEELATDEVPDYVKQHEHSLTFPEKLMLILTYAERVQARAGKRAADTPIRWLDGTAIEICNKDFFVSSWVPRFFCGSTTFSSFTRKLYRWGFRKIHSGNSTAATASSSHSAACDKYKLTNNSIPLQQRGPIFVHEHFQRDKPEQLSKMRSVTASKTRGELMKAINWPGAVGSTLSGGKGNIGLGVGLFASAAETQATPTVDLQQLFSRQVSNQMSNGRIIASSLSSNPTNLLYGLLQHQLRPVQPAPQVGHTALSQLLQATSAFPSVLQPTPLPASVLGQAGHQGSTVQSLSLQVSRGRGEESQRGIFQSQQEHGLRQEQQASLAKLLLQLGQSPPSPGPAMPLQKSASSRK